MPGYKWDFNSCAIRDGFCKSSHILCYKFASHDLQFKISISCKLCITLHTYIDIANSGIFVPHCAL